MQIELPAATSLPSEYIDRFKQPIGRFLHIESMAGAILLLSTIAALVISNSTLVHFYESAWETPMGLHVGSLEYARSFREWVNDGLMTLFFFLVALELKRELVLGELNRPHKAVFSIAAAVGGMVVPASVYLALQYGQTGEQGWGTVMATDTAFVIGCLALLGTRIPKSLRVFMLSLAIVDDIGAILVVAIGYSSTIGWGALLVAGIGLLIVRTMTFVGIRGIPLYILIGMFIWAAVDASGIHATITGVILGLMTPARRWVSDVRLYAILDQVIAHPTNEENGLETQHRETLQMAETAARETLSPVERIEFALHPWVAFVIMPLFAFGNAGLPLTLSNSSGSITVAIFLGFVLGKPLGVLLFSWAAVQFGLAVRPSDLNWKLIAGGSVLTGIGFTMALFIANLAFTSQLVDSAKLGIFLASLTSALIGMALLWTFSPRQQFANPAFKPTGVSK